MYLKIYRIDGIEKIVAACDQELINKTISEGDIEITVSDKFYGTDIATEDELIGALNRVNNANLVGKRVISIASKCGAISEENCLYINGIPHIQIL
ncbi:DUF424 family protein [Methanomicrobium antiquum]|uniref:DUF424 family protein n=1 Tax=Methanomicrobium antiquum TaxID=487686 RepID=A0AAF0FTK8_9EURY|nr:DUF424 family protein [Methanomicrobium antiquum]MDD3977261.1 DUF424 family protein [Methanomicrobium sp.]WFN37936.1 DUF424 family protein [Methanomicrobium antiquum]